MLQFWDWTCATSPILMTQYELCHWTFLRLKKNLHNINKLRVFYNCSTSSAVTGRRKVVTPSGKRYVICEIACDLLEIRTRIVLVAVQFVTVIMHVLFLYQYNLTWFFLSFNLFTQFGDHYLTNHITKKYL